MRALGISVTIAGQDFANLMMAGKEEADTIYGNAVLILLYVRNVKELSEKVAAQVGEADIAVESGLERKGSVVGGFIQQANIAIQRRTRLTGFDLGSLKTGEAFLVAGRNFGIIRYFPFAPLPDVAPEMSVGRYLPIVFEEADLPEVADVGNRLTALVEGRAEGTAPPPGADEDLTRTPRALLEFVGESGGGARQWASAVRAFLDGRVTVSSGRRLPPGLPARTAEPLHAAATAGLPPVVPVTPMQQLRNQGAETTETARVDAGEAARRLTEKLTTQTQVGEEAKPGSGGREADCDSDRHQGEIAPFQSIFSAEAQAEIPPEDWTDEAEDKIPSTLELPEYEQQPDPLDTLPYHEELDRETEDDAVGDPADTTVTENLQRVARDLDVADRAFDSMARSMAAKMSHGSARDRDLVTGIQAASRYHPPEDYPREPLPADAVRSTVDRILANVGQARGKTSTSQNNEAATDGSV